MRKKGPWGEGENGISPRTKNGRANLLFNLSTHRQNIVHSADYHIQKCYNFDQLVSSQEATRWDRVRGKVYVAFDHSTQNKVNYTSHRGSM